jgi:hypothetical protein
MYIEGIIVFKIKASNFYLVKIYAINNPQLTNILLDVLLYLLQKSCAR